MCNSLVSAADRFTHGLLDWVSNGERDIIFYALFDGEYDAAAEELANGLAKGLGDGLADTLADELVLY